MKLNKLPAIIKSKKKRVGRGKRGSKGAKSGRGTKGALKRGKMRLYFEGGALPLTKRLPMLRGKGKNKPLAAAPIIVNVDQLNQFRNGAVITVSRLCKQGIIDQDVAERRGVKLLGRGNLQKKLKIVDIPVSAGGAEKIKKAGGSIGHS